MISVRRVTYLWAAALLAGPLVMAHSAAGQKVTMESLLREMVDMERLATMPQPGVECDQQSSYDRASVAPDKDGWFANGDAGQFIRQEQKDGQTEYVMAEMTGPGAIVRLWSANPDGGGNIRIYIDDLDKPALQADFLALTSAQMPEFPAPFSGRRSLGANLYFPLPYQTRCKVTVDKPNLYYHVGYRTYPPGTEVEPFSMAALAAVRDTMEDVGTTLSRAWEPFHLEGAKKLEVSGIYPMDVEKPLLVLDGPAAIMRMEVRVTMPPGTVREQLQDTLRGMLLTISFDDEPDPCVCAPLGDFFGSTPGINPYASLPVGMRKDGVCYCNWYMPFAKRARIALRNEAAEQALVELKAWTKPITWRPGETLYFHAKWRSEWLPREPAFLDWRMLEATGPGRFVGVMLGVMNTQSGWWGEGDEKVWVDDDVFPSYIGTGSEDYFGYAWCNPIPFTHAYHNQSICTGPGNFGYTAVARYHILDDIPFQKSIKFDIEKWAGADRQYCCTTYWYAAPGATDFFQPPTYDQRRVLPLPELFRVKGAAEGERLKVVRCTGGETQVQNLFEEFSGGKHLWWLYAPEGSVLEVAVPVPKAGKYHVTAVFTKSWDYGIHQPMINGQDVGEPLDLYSPQIVPLKVDFGEFELAQGEMLFGLRCIGSNAKANPVHHMAGIDYVLLTPVE